MHVYKYIVLCSLALLLINCGNTNTAQLTGLAIDTKVKSILLGDTLDLSIKNPKQLNITKVTYQLDGQTIEKNTVLNNTTLGEKTLTAIVTYDDKTETLTKSIKIYNNIISIYIYL